MKRTIWDRNRLYYSLTFSSLFFGVVLAPIALRLGYLRLVNVFFAISLTLALGGLLWALYLLIVEE